MKKNKHIQPLTLELRDSRNEKEWSRQRVVVATIEQINSPYPWPDTLMVSRSRNNTVVEYRINRSHPVGGEVDRAGWRSIYRDKGGIIMTQFCTHVCSNCQAWTDADLCSACRFLAQDVKYAKERLWGENQGLFNRRWQMYFNRGDLRDDGYPSNGWATTPLWEQRRRDQDW